ncbi:MAG: cysteine desulfurase [Oscillospiraceae bacterium]|nr:cysteine desulfurase [Oscillospiraceae bacterium]
MISMKVYADHAATSPLRREALDAMMPYLTERYGNPSSIYSLASAARRAVESARADIAGALGASESEIYFTGSGTESDNLAIRGALEARAGTGRHVVTSAIEHHAVLHTLQALEKRGAAEVSYLPVDEYGLVAPDALRDAIRPDTALVTIMTANNEIGVIQPIDELGAIARERGVPFHTDAVQAAGHIPLDARAMNVDMLSVSAHKFGGPKGAGALYLRKGVRLAPLIYGGGHERGLRSGTENVAGIAGMAAALKQAVTHMAEETARVSEAAGIVKAGLGAIPFARLTGHPEKRLPGIVSFVFEAVEGESMVLALDFGGICASSGSACSSGSLEPSHVLLAVGLPHEIAHGSLRLSFGPENTPEQARYVVQAVTDAVASRREMSPLWRDNKPAY